MTIDFKEIARTMLQGWCDSHNNDHQEMEVGFEKQGFNSDDAIILSMFGCWANDLTDMFAMAEHIRLGIELNADTDKAEIVDVPAPPEEYLRIMETDDQMRLNWSCGHYGRGTGGETTWVRGTWVLTRELGDDEAQVVTGTLQ